MSGLDLIPRDPDHVDSTRIIRECAAQAGLDFNTFSMSGVNLLHRVVAAAHKAGFKLAISRALTPGYRVLKDTTHAEREWVEDANHENGRYSNTCVDCLREFVGHKRRVVCRACAKP